jgi:hypothetical protein
VRLTCALDEERVRDDGGRSGSTGAAEELGTGSGSNKGKRRGRREIGVVSSGIHGDPTCQHSPRSLSPQFLSYLNQHVIL